MVQPLSRDPESDPAPSDHGEERGRAARAMQRVFWWSRLIVLIPVAFSILLAGGLIYIATADAVYVILHLGTYIGGESPGDAARRAQLIGKIVKIADVYLLAAFLFVFAFGLYELFIGKLPTSGDPEGTSRLLIIDSLDDLKARLGQVTLLILIVEFLQIAFELRYTRPLDLLYLAIAILLIAGALALGVTHRHGDLRD